MSEENLHAKALKDLRDRMRIEVSSDRTLMIVVVTHDDPVKNELTRVSCRKGFPLFGYLYDSQGDSYYIECVDYFTLGYIHVSFFQTMPGVGNWKTRIPMPESTTKIVSLQSVCSHLSWPKKRLELNICEERRTATCPAIIEAVFDPMLNTL